MATLGAESTDLPVSHLRSRTARSHRRRLDRMATYLTAYHLSLSTMYLTGCRDLLGNSRSEARNLGDMVCKIAGASRQSEPAAGRNKNHLKSF